MAKHAPKPAFALVSRQGLGRGLAFSTANFHDAALRIERFRSLEPSLYYIERGAETLIWPGHKTEVAQGQMWAAPKGALVTLERHHPKDAPFQAYGLCFDEALITTFQAQYPQSPKTPGLCPLPQIERSLKIAFGSAMAALGDPSLPHAIAQHRLIEILLWLSQKGFGFMAPAPQDLPDRITALITQSPGSDWSVEALAKKLGLSEAGLRRGLKAHGLTPNEWVTDIKMAIALERTQGSEQNLHALGLDLGYECASRFSARFKAHFGLSPSRLRGHQR